MEESAGVAYGDDCQGKVNIVSICILQQEGHDNS